MTRHASDVQDPLAGPVPRWRLVPLLLLAGLPVVATTALAPVAIGLGLPQLLPYPFWTFALYALMSWAAVGLLIAAAGRPLLQASGLRWRWGGRRGIAALLAFALGVGLYLLVDAALRRAGLPTVQGMQFELRTGTSVLVVLLAIVITAPICEEILFRVLWVGLLSRNIGVPAAVAGSLIFFSAIHYPYFGFGGVIFIAAWSLLPLALFVGYRDLTAPLLMHVLNNAFAYVIVPLWLT